MRRSPRALAGWLVVTACGPTSPREAADARAPSVSDAAADAGEAGRLDAAEPPVDCPHVRFETPDLVLRECPESARIALADTPTSAPFAWLEVYGGGPAGGPGADRLAPLLATELPGITWRSDAEGVDVRYAAEDGLSPLAGGDADAALGLTLTVEGGALLIAARLSWPAGARFPAPYHPAVRLRWADPDTRLRGAYGRMELRTADTTLLLTPTALDGATTTLMAEGQRAVSMHPAEAADLRPGETWHLPVVALDRGETLADAQAAWLGRQHLRLGTRPPVARWGWRSRHAFGSLVSARALADVAASLPYLPNLPPPVLIADGRWFDRYGADSPSPGFPEGVGGAAAAVRAAGADLVLRWAPLTLDPEPGCETCTLDARDPAVREGSARRAEQLFRGDVAGLLLDLPSGAPVPDSFYAVLRRVAGARHLLLGRVDPEAGLPGGVQVDAGLLPLAPAPLTGDPCGDTIVQASQDRTCADALRSLAGLVSLSAEAGTDAQARHVERSAALVDLWPLSGAGQLIGDGGFSVAEGTEADCRRTAALSALAGGLYLLTDVPATLPPERLELFLAPLRRGLLRWPAARPAWSQAPADAPPDVWHRAGHALAIFNDGAVARHYPSPETLAPELAGRRLVDVFSGQPLPADRRLAVPAGDVRVLVAEPDDME